MFGRTSSVSSSNALSLLETHRSRRLSAHLAGLYLTCAGRRLCWHHLRRPQIAIGIVGGATSTAAPYPSPPTSYPPPASLIPVVDMV